MSGCTLIHSEKRKETKIGDNQLTSSSKYISVRGLSPDIRRGWTHLEKAKDNNNTLPKVYCVFTIPKNVSRNKTSAKKPRMKL